MDGRQLSALAVAAVVGLVPVAAASQSADSAAAPQTRWGGPGPAGRVGLPHADTHGAT